MPIPTTLFNHLSNTRYSINQIPDTNPDEPKSIRNFIQTYYFLRNCYPSISSVLIAKNVPADRARNTADVTSFVEEIIHPVAIDSEFNSACIMINQYDIFGSILLFL